MPGSRRSEVHGHFPRMLAIARQIEAVYPGAGFLIPTTPSMHAFVSELLADAVAGEFKSLAHSVELLDGGINAMLPRCDICIPKSGTTTLQVAAYGVPMFIVYYVPPLTWHALGRWVRKWVVTTRFFGLVNILAEHDGRPHTDGPLVPEIMPWHEDPQVLGQQVLDLLAHPERLAAQRQALLDTVRPLDRTGASDRTAAIAIKMISHGSTAAR